MIHRKHMSITATLAAFAVTTLSACGADSEPAAAETVTTTVTAAAETESEAEPTDETTSDSTASDDAATEDTSSEDTTSEPSDTETAETGAGDDDTTDPESAETDETKSESEPAEEASTDEEHEYPEQEPQNIMGDGKAEFIHFTVESLPPPTEPPADDERTWAYVRTCVNATPWDFIDTGKTPISADAYGIELAPSGKKLKRVSAEGLEPAYPEQSELPPHDCAEGFIAFEPIEEDIDALIVTYNNSLGESASWNYH